MMTTLSVPLPKNDELPGAAGVRPIAMGQTFAKILSRCLARWLYPLVSARIHGCQHGYSAGRGVDPALVSLELEAFGLHAEGTPAKGWLFLLDIARAFPSLRHDFLFQIIKASDAPSWLLRALRRVVTMSRTCFKLATAAGPWLDVTQGLLQGEPCSALLFIWALDTLIRRASFEMPRSCWMGAFVDDLAVVLSSERLGASWLVAMQTFFKLCAGLVFQHHLVRALALDQASKDAGLVNLCALDPAYHDVLVLSGARYLGFWFGAEGNTQAWLKPLEKVEQRAEVILDLAVGSPAQERLANIIAWTCLSHLLALLPPSQAVYQAYARLTRMMFRGPKGWLSSAVVQHLELFSWRSLPPKLAEFSWRLRLLTICRRKWRRPPKLLEITRASVHHDELPLRPYLAALGSPREAAHEALEASLLELDGHGDLKPKTLLRQALMKKAKFRKRLLKVLSEPGRPLHGGIQLIRAWLARRLQRVMRFGWVSNLRLDQVTRSLLYVAKRCPPKCLNALFRVLTDGVVLDFEGAKFPGCLLSSTCGGANDLYHYCGSLCRQKRFG